jgi:hypothetical protein
MGFVRAGRWRKEGEVVDGAAAVTARHRARDPGGGGTRARAWKQAWEGYRGGGGGGCEQIMGMAGEVMRGVGGLTHLLGGGGYIGGASMSVRGGAGAWPRRGAHG